MTAPNELSFLPEDYLEQKWKRRAHAVCLVLIGLAGAGIAASWSWEHGHSAKIDAQFTEVENRYNEAARRIAQVKKMNDQQAEVMRHAELTASLYERVPRSNVLAELTMNLPPGMSLVDIEMSSTPHRDDGPAKTSFDARLAAQQGSQTAIKPPAYDVKIAVTGIAVTDVQVAQYITKLRTSPSKLFTDVNLVVSDSFEERRADGQKTDASDVRRKWQIEMMLNPHAEVGNDTKTAAVELSK